MVYEDWPKRKAAAKVSVSNPIMLCGRILNVTANIDAEVTITADGRAVSFPPMQDAWIKWGLKEVAEADTVGIEARGPDAVIVAGALKAAIEGKRNFGWLHKVQWANEARKRPSGAPYTTVSFEGSFGF